MTHQVLVIGGGYAGLMAATRVARRTRGADVQVTLVNRIDRFVERVRLHQAGSGGPTPRWLLRDVLAGTGVRTVVAEVTGVDPERRTVHARAGGEPADLAYDTLVYAPGSGADRGAVPGAAEYAHTLAEVTGADGLAARVPALAAAGGTLAVVGGGLTGIEAATELAEAHPGLAVRMVTGGGLGAGLSERGRAHVRRVLGRLGVRLSEHARVAAVTEEGLVLDDGTPIAADAVVWNAGFTVPAMARDAGLDVDARGRVIVDATQRSVSHPDVYAVGDAARALGRVGGELRMACATGLPMGAKAADAIAARIAGRVPRPLAFRYYIQCISLGRRDGLIQFVHADDAPTPVVLTGRLGALVKEAVVRGASIAARAPYLRRGRRTAPEPAARAAAGR
ncbi:NADH dehydrogenase FAD-containing subunit [Murinocardiopsis flavida]|uniref:NADH dehydrogenase FAD-containing subunit n=1 Tax=Murinocardiopsis flavida TaxID=645275 RepID=A0A2P8CEZ7_9ACTN|nr:FAD-dependent oxidoreductase [Murinocardiopsis flavida]PSK83573.1 NADH dehydrogenase FAD-containing subunit [Murinocardiopsis flavida]